MWHINLGGQPVGPIDERDVAVGLANGSYDGRTQVWRQGFTNWTPIADTELNRFMPRFVVNPNTVQPAPRKRLYLIVGSVLGFVASVVGLSAAFFPDAFNLSRKKFAAFTAQVDGVAEMEALENFLHENRGNIVQLDLSVCSTSVSLCPKIEASKNMLAFRFGDKHGEVCDGEKNTRMQGVSFDFGEGQYWGWEKLGECRDGKSEGLSRMNGHYLVPSDAGFGMGWSVWILSPISAKEIELRNY